MLWPEVLVEYVPSAQRAVAPAGTNHSATPPWREHVPWLEVLVEYVPSPQRAVAPAGANHSATPPWREHVP